MAAGDVALKVVSDTLNSNSFDTVTITPDSNHHLTGAFVHSCAPEVSLVGVTVAALGASMTMRFKVAGPGGALTYPVVIHATQIDTSG